MAKNEEFVSGCTVRRVQADIDGLFHEHRSSWEPEVEDSDREESSLTNTIPLVSVCTLTNMGGGGALMG